MALCLYEGDGEAERVLPCRLIRWCVHLGVCSVQNMLHVNVSQSPIVLGIIVL